MTTPLSHNWQESWNQLEKAHENIGMDYVINPVLYRELAQTLRTNEKASLIDFGAGTHALAREFLLGNRYENVALKTIPDLNDLRSRITAAIGLEGDPALTARGQKLLRNIEDERLLLQYHVVREGVYAPFANASAEIVTSRQFLMHLSTPDLMQHLKEVERILKPGGTYICTILNPEYEQRKQQELHPDKSPLIAHQAYDFSHGTTGHFPSLIPQYWRSLENYQTAFAQNFADVTCIECTPVTDRFKETKPRYYQSDCPMALVFVLKKALI